MVGILVVSGFVTATSPKEIPILDNHPPNKPKITGQMIVKTGTNEWTFKTIDPDGDDVCYEISWGDDSREWTDWYASGEEVIKNHTYPGVRKVLIGARAKDIHGAISDWEYMNVAISKDKQIFNLPFLQFIINLFQGWLM